MKKIEKMKKRTVFTRTEVESFTVNGENGYFSDLGYYDVFACPYGGVSTEDNCDGCCNDCFTAEERRYTFKPDPLFEFPENRVDVLHLGMELETQSNGESPDIYSYIRSVFNEFNGKYYCKSDGSLDCNCEYGTETVSHPLSVKTLLNDADTICELNKENNLFGHYTQSAGLHFHIDLKYLTGQNSPSWETRENAQAKMFILIEMLYKTNRQKMQKIDRRKGHYDYCCPALTTAELTGNSMIKMEHAKNKLKTDRYRLVNCSNANTVELRFFKSTVNAETLKNDILIVQALAEIVRKYSVRTVTNYTFDKFMKYLEKNADKYQTVINYIESL